MSGIDFPISLGSLHRPMTDAQIEAKVREHAAGNAREAPVERLIAAVWALDRADDAGELARLSASPERAPPAGARAPR